MGFLKGFQFAYVQTFCGGERFSFEGFDEVKLGTNISVEYGYAFAYAMCRVGIAAARTFEAKVPRNIQCEDILLVGVAAVGDLHVVHKLE